MDWMDRWLDKQVDKIGRMLHPMEAADQERAEQKSRMEIMSDRELKFISGEAGHLYMWAARVERAARLQKKWSSMK